MAKCKLTMRDISRATGLSMFTVSRALNGADGVSEESREQIRRAARELGYIPNRAAQELRRASRDAYAHDVSIPSSATLRSQPPNTGNQ